MEYAIGILGVVVGGLMTWAFSHASQCASFHERLARLEERMGMRQ